MCVSLRSHTSALCCCRLEMSAARGSITAFDVVARVDFSVTPLAGADWLGVKAQHRNKHFSTGSHRVLEKNKTATTLRY